MKLEIIITLLTALLFTQYTFAQFPEIDWDRTYGGTNDDAAFSVQQTLDGGFVFAGYTQSFGADSNDVYLVKTDSLGNIDWYRLYGGEDYDDAQSLRQTSDGGYIIAGRTASFGAGSIDMYVVKTNSQGDTIWTNTYGGVTSDDAESVIQTSDRGYAIAGDFRLSYMDLYEMYLVKTDSLGDTLWTRTYGGPDDRTAHCIRQTSDGGYILVGDNTQSSGYDIYLVKTDCLGNLQWTGTYGGDETDRARSVLQTLDGGYVVVGFTYSFGVGWSDVYVIKTDSLGDTLWTRTYGGYHYDYADEVQQTHDGNYIIVGGTLSYGAGDYNLYMLKINTIGDTIWTMVYGGEDSEYGRSVALTSDGGYIVSGEFRIYIPPYDYLTDALLVKTGPDTAVSGAPVIQWVSQPKDFILHPAYPNPFNPTTVLSFSLSQSDRISLEIYNVVGNRVAKLADGWYSAGIHRKTWIANDLPSGIYFARLSALNVQETRKLLLIK